MFHVALGSNGFMPVCSTCAKWDLLAGRCTVCGSADRLWALISSPRIPPTREAEAKVTKILDTVFYSVGRLVQEEEDEPAKGESSPSKASKGEGSPKPTEGEKKEKSSKARGEDRGRKAVPKEEKPRSKEKEEREEAEGAEKKEVREKTVHVVEEKKTLPKRKEEDKSKRSRSRTPKHQKEKEKRKDKKKDSKSRSVSGSVVRKKKREDYISQRPVCEETPGSARPSSGIQRETYLRPRPSRREPRSPRTPDHPPPRVPPVQPGGGPGAPQGSGWRGSIPYSHHPRWTESTNKGITKRAKQELHERKQYRGRW